MHPPSPTSLLIIIDLIVLITRKGKHPDFYPPSHYSITPPMTRESWSHKNRWVCQLGVMGLHRSSTGITTSSRGWDDLDRLRHQLNNTKVITWRKNCITQGKNYFRGMWKLRMVRCDTYLGGRYVCVGGRGVGWGAMMMGWNDWGLERTDGHC